MKIYPIGIIYTPFNEKEGTPIQPSRSNAEGIVQVFKKYQAGLDDLEGFSHVILVFRFHRSKGFKLKTIPFLDRVPRGLFATRYPRRPNQIGISIVRLLKRKKNMLYVKGVDILNGTPLLDVKPYLPDFDPKGRICVGWYKGKVK